MSDCLFCRIVEGDLPSTGVASTELSYAFDDVQPEAPVHVLVVPRRHIVDADSLRPEDAEVLGDMFVTAQAVARAKQISQSGYRIVFNVGADASNSVPHLHLHVLGGRPLGWPPG